MISIQLQVQYVYAHSCFALLFAFLAFMHIIMYSNDCLIFVIYAIIVITAVTIVPHLGLCEHNITSVIQLLLGTLYNVNTCGCVTYKSVAQCRGTVCQMFMTRIHMCYNMVHNIRYDSVPLLPCTYAHRGKSNRFRRRRFQKIAGSQVLGVLASAHGHEDLTNVCLKQCATDGESHAICACTRGVCSTELYSNNNNKEGAHFACSLLAHAQHQLPLT